MGMPVEARIMVAGMIVLLLGMLLVAFSGLSQAAGVSSGSVIIFIGPIPIVVGWGPYSTQLVVIGIAIAVAMAVIAFLMMAAARRVAPEPSGR